MDWSTLVPTLVGATLALVGGIVSPWFGARIGHRSWKRDKISELAESCYAALQSGRHTISVLSDLVGLTPDKVSPEFREMFDTSFKRLLDSSSKLDMYCSNTLKREVEIAYTMYFMVWMHIADRSEWDDATRSFEDAVLSVRKAIRRELNLD